MPLSRGFFISASIFLLGSVLIYISVSTEEINDQERQGFMNGRVCMYVAMRSQIRVYDGSYTEPVDEEITSS
jgi:hypothetical protein